ncbi:REST corepressor 3-like [Uloborus diversus]|uniref:REST corepressor 3-like n=1 Tax=Uloborus diversus TaxID=327109 RepID=UPI00240A0784|nr:REST corepressor 3-like [Uloborus diversus]
MVLSERGVQDIRSGRRSRAASPSANGHYSDESSNTDESEYSMKVGPEYQAVIPDLVSTGPCPAYENENALLVWSPCPAIEDEKLDKYINEAKEKCGYNVEQALGMLFWHKYDVEKATADLQNYTPFPDEWTTEDKVLFEQGFQFHGKSFNRIRQMLPDKPLASLIKFYYLWKKARSRTSLMDRQVRKLSAQKEEGSGSEAPSDNESDMDPDKEGKPESSIKGNCVNCSVSTQVYSTPKGNLCNPCCQYFKRTGTLRAGGGGSSLRARHNPQRSKRRPPKGMHLDYDDLVAIVTGPSGDGDAILRGMDCEIISLKRQVQNSKQMISQQKHKLSAGVDMFRPPETANRINTRWSGDELLLAVQGVRKYGRDFKAVAEVVGNKTEANIKSFFVNYRRRFNLDGVLQEYDAEHGTPHEDSEERMEQENGTSNGGRPDSPATPQGAPPLLHPPQSPATNSSTTGSQQRLCPPSLQQANATSRNSGRTLLQQPPPLICPSNSFVAPPKAVSGHESM